MDDRMPFPEILVAGETLIDFLPDRPGPLADVESFSRRAGGAPANVAVALARLDRPPLFLTNVSKDTFGDFLADELRSNGVPERFVTRDPDRPTTLAFVAHDADADREFTFYRTDTADHHLDPTVVDNETLESVSWVALGGVLLSSEPARSRLFDFAERAREHDCTVVFDPNARPELWPDDVTFERVLDRMFSLTDVCKTSRADLEDTRFADGSVRIDALLDAGPHTVFVTHGGSGARAVADEQAPWGAMDETHPGYTVEPVDTTGAGDGFLAGVLSGLADGKSLDEVLGFANAVAALTTTEPGANTALPDRETVADFRTPEE